MIYNENKIASIPGHFCLIHLVLYYIYRVDYILIKYNYTLE